MTIEQLSKKLSKLLGDDYGGPSLSYDKKNKEFILYIWHDAPVCTEILWRGKDLTKIEDQ